MHALHERAKMIVEMELQHPNWHAFCEFMHVAEAADEDSMPAPEWEGITGRVKQLLQPTNDRMADVQQEMTEVRSEMAEVRQEMQNARVEMAGKMDELKDLLQLLLAKK